MYCLKKTSEANFPDFTTAGMGLRPAQWMSSSVHVCFCMCKTERIILSSPIWCYKSQLTCFHCLGNKMFCSVGLNPLCKLHMGNSRIGLLGIIKVLIDTVSTGRQYTDLKSADRSVVIRLVLKNMWVWFMRHIQCFFHILLELIWFKSLLSEWSMSYKPEHNRCQILTFQLEGHIHYPTGIILS